jgi:hypothetical protein
VRPAEMLRLNTTIAPSASPKRLGVLDGDKAGYPNGRRLTDDVVDISLQVVEGELAGNPNDLGDGVDANDKPFGSSFPYVALPTSGSDVRPASQSSKAAPSAGTTQPGAATPSTTTPQPGAMSDNGTRQGGAMSGAMQNGASASSDGSTEARDGMTQLNADNSASRVSSDRLSTPVASALAAGMVILAAAVVYLGRRWAHSGRSTA